MQAFLSRARHIRRVGEMWGAWVKSDRLKIFLFHFEMIATLQKLNLRRLKI